MRVFNRIPILVTVTILTMTLLAGCRFSMLDLGPRKMTTRYFELRTMPQDPVSGNGWLRQQTLVVDLFQTDHRYDTRFYQVKPGNEITLSERRRWVRPPGEMISSQIREALAQSGLFECVTGPGSNVRPDLRLSGEVIRFDLIESAGNISAVMLQVSAVLLLETRQSQSPNPGFAPKIIWQKRLTATAPVTGGSEPAVCAAAMSTAVTQAIQDLLRELATLPQP